MTAPATALADRDWRLVPAERRPGPLQLALDEVAARTAGAGGPCTVRVYRWASPGTLSLGYAQDPSVVDWRACRARGIDVTRRRTGGGAIYHDAAGDVAYAIAAPADALPGSTVERYRLLLEPVLDALERLGVPGRLAAEGAPGRFRPACYLRPLHEAHDLVVDAAAGEPAVASGDASPGASVGTSVRKIAGSAQYRTRDAVLQHGSLAASLAAARRAAVFADGPGPDAFRRRVGALDEFGVGADDAVDSLEAALAEWAGASAGVWTEDELAAARQLAGEKYRSDAWIRDGAAPSGDDPA